MYDKIIKSRDGDLGGNGDTATEEKDGHLWEETVILEADFQMNRLQFHHDYIFLEGERYLESLMEHEPKRTKSKSFT